MKIREMVKNWLGITRIEHKIENIENLILHKKSKLNGFAVLKKHLNRTDIKLPQFMGLDIEQD